MKHLKYFLMVLMAIAVSGNAYAQLSATNGLAAGKSLLALYTQYKADGKLDLGNANNITNIVSLITNVKGLTSGATTSTTPQSFVSNLISGSNGLVTNSNANSVLNTLGSISTLDTKSLTSSATSSAVSSAIGGLLGQKGSTKAANTAESAVTAASALTSLFKTLKD